LGRSVTEKKIVSKCNLLSLIYPECAVCILKLLKLYEKCVFTYV